MKEPDYGRGIVKLIADLHQMGIMLTYDNPYRTNIDILSLVDELDLNAKQDCLPSALFGPIGPSSNPWHGRSDILDRLEWIQLPARDDREITLRWPITSLSMDEARFNIPPIFNGIEFVFNTPVARGDARQFLKWQKYMMEVVDFANIRRIQVTMERVDAFYLAFPFFMRYQSNRVLSLHIQRLPLGKEGTWIRRQWKIKRGKEEEEDIRLEGLAKDDIHVHPARLFERIMFNLMFYGERKVREIICVFYDRYSRS